MFELKPSVIIVLIASFLSICIISSTVLYIKYLKNDNHQKDIEIAGLNLSIEEQNISIKQWQDEALLAEKRIKTDENKFRIDLVKKTKEIESLDHEELSNNCDENRSFLIKHAQELSQ